MKAIAYPFNLDSFGRIVSTTDSNKVYLDRVLTLLSTMVYTRPIKTGYGADVSRSLYETYNRYDVAIAESIERAMGVFLPEVQIEDLRITEPDGEGVSTVDLTVILPDSSVNYLSINTGYFSSNGISLGDQ